MSRDWSKVSPSIWSSSRFMGLDSDARVLVLYYVCGPHQNSSGCARIKEGYACADLDWTPERYRAAQGAVITAELVTVDGDEVFVDRWFQHNPPTNKDHAKGAKKLISRIDSDVIREKAEAEFMNTEWGARAFPSSQPEEQPGVIHVSDSLMKTRMLANKR